MGRIKWYYERLKAMSPAEVVWRIGQKREEISKLRKYDRKDRFITEKDLLGDGAMALSDRRFIPDSFYVDLKGVRGSFQENCKASDLEYADKICEGKVKIFGDIVEFGKEIDWMSSFSNGMRWPLEYSPELEFRQRDDIGDVRINWELSRHYHSAVLARAFYTSSRRKYLDSVRENFYSWALGNPFMKGVGWTSPMEMAIRAYSWMWTYAILHACVRDEEKELLEDIKCAVLNQVEYVLEHRSRYSSANNHLIVEMSIVCICAVMFGIKSWIDDSVDILSGEIKRQVHEDGVDKEQSIHYHSFVVESYMLCLSLLKKNSIQYPKHIEEVLDKMCLFIRDMMDCGKGVVEIGDSDEGKLLDLYGRDAFEYYEYVLQGCSLLLGRKYVSMEKLQPDIEWLFDVDGKVEKLEKLPPQKSAIYEHGGYSVIRGASGLGEVVMTLDHGELGYGSIAAHGHADALSITLRIGGKQVFADPGTYVYHTKRGWRDYFRKTVNHNTIEIRGEDQSEMKGEFLWGKRACAQVRTWKFTEYEDFVSARHDGYAPIVHERDVSYKKPSLIEITDRMHGGDAGWTMTFMLAEGAGCKKVSGRMVEVFIDEEKSFALEFESDSEIHVSIEKEWISSGYMEKEETLAIRCRGNMNGEQRVITTMHLSN